MANPNTYPVPADQHHLPRHQRQHPFRWLNEAERLEVRHEAGEAIAGMGRLIRKLVNKQFSQHCRSDRDDAEQEISLRLLTHSLPQYDAWRRSQAKVPTFLHTCIYWHVKDLTRRFRRRPVHAIIDYEPFAPDTSHDRQIEELSDLVRERPRLLGKHGRAILNHAAGVTNADAAAALGIARQTLLIARSDARKAAVELLHAA